MLTLRERLFLLASQALNALCFAGDPDETLSARAWRQRADPVWRARAARLDRWLGTDHCFNSHVSQLLRASRRLVPKTKGSR